MSTFNRPSCVIIGSTTLPIQCAERLLSLGYAILCIVTDDTEFAAWSHARAIPTCGTQGDLLTSLRDQAFDYLFSIVNGSIIPTEVLALARAAAINYHDGPLPRYAGFNATAWGILNGESDYGITWHLMGAKLDAGDIVKQAPVVVDVQDTSFTLNAKCYEAAVRSFAELASEIAGGRMNQTRQDLSRRTYVKRFDRPKNACTISWQTEANKIDALCRALEFGPYPNPIGLPKIHANGVLLAVRTLTVLETISNGPTGTVVRADRSGIQVTTATEDVLISRVTTLDGRELTNDEVIQMARIRQGESLSPQPLQVGVRTSELHIRVAPHEPQWVMRLGALKPLMLSNPSDVSEQQYGQISIPLAGEYNDIRSAIVATLIARRFGSYLCDLGYYDEDAFSEYEGLRAFEQWIPIKVDFSSAPTLQSAVGANLTRIAEAKRLGPFLRDIWDRYPKLNYNDRPRVGVRICNRTERPAAGCDLMVQLLTDGMAKVIWNKSVVSSGRAEGLAAYLEEFSPTLLNEPEMSVAKLPRVSSAEFERLARAWNNTDTELSQDASICSMIQEQVQRTPEAIALVSGHDTLTYEELERRANALATHLQNSGISVGSRVAVSVPRSLGMVVALVAILKAGAAYVPLDPLYPIDRLQFMLADSGAEALIAGEEHNAAAADFKGLIVHVDAFGEGTHSRATGEVMKAKPQDIAYVMYTSGSTGKPKGVMVTHRNVVNFFAGMDRTIGTESGTWLAITSISFDISVLEIFWTLARGFKVVLHHDEIQRASAGLPAPLEKGAIEFSLFYFAASEATDTGHLYKLLLDGARYADEHGFCAVWTPERHFHSFGGIYPNPSVVSAAIAAVTKNLQIRAGSVVLPIHDPIRVAEEWAVVDNLSNGRVGISFASGWQANDFVLAPDAYADSKRAMVQSIEVVRALWRGEAIKRKNGKGVEIDVRTLPRPIQGELPSWITAAGSVETFKVAGQMGCGILTHLLGQTIAELAPKVQAYRQAWRDAGHPDGGHVTLMMHTFIGSDVEEVRETVRKPMCDYLRTSADLIRNSPWSFPAFMKKTAWQPDNGAGFEEDDMEAMVQFAFDRHFENSGLFGTPDSCLAQLDRVKRAGVDEVACLIDFGVEVELVLKSLDALNQLRENANRVVTTDLPTVAEQIERSNVTHLQCVPSLLRTVASDAKGKRALGSLKQLLVGGEPLPASLANDVVQATGVQVFNMYGPTECTVWSTAWKVEHGDSISIGKPVANTQIYILDRELQLAPQGEIGEIFIGGEGVALGYLGLPELTTSRFLEDPFQPGSRMYATGDLARQWACGRIEHLGRADDQVKIRGHRIELGEIESVLESHEDVQHSAVVSREFSPGDTRLIAFVVAPTLQDSEVLLKYAQRKLPVHMTPSAIRVIESMPRTPNGKVDRAALPDIAAMPVVSNHTYVPPAGDLERIIALAWQEALGVEKVGRNDNFFDLGAHSLLMFQVNRRLREQLNRDVPLMQMYRFPTLSLLAANLDKDTGGESVQKSVSRGQARRAMLAQRAVNRSAHA